MTTQQAQPTRIGDAVDNKLVSNSTLAYFMVKTFQFLQKIGVKRENIRFRQHLLNEMAHYACDCWDAEIFTSYGWVECVGHADRACYDLQQHMEHSKTDLQMARKLENPYTKQVLVEKFEKGLMGKELKKDCQLAIK